METRHLNPDGTPKHTNRLISETSPYLRQHAHNPVDWYPWGEEAFRRAVRERKPIHLSVGYAACHWCHVLAAESFEDEPTAQVLNELFVNIKVDREERPDVDRIYQIAQQMLTQRSGGWPLTMFLTPDDRRPFFGGTYFPREARFGLPAFRELLLRVARYYHEHEAELRQQNEALMSAFAQLEPPAPEATVELGDAPLRLCRQALERTFDPRYGGFGGAPKFPHPKSLELLLRQWRAGADGDTPDLHALYMSGLTLRRMADGGINDQLAGGFCRYSVDEYWMIPHFEKMLYDNGSLLAVYADTYVATGDEFYGRVAAQTADWVRREMQSPEGGYYSSLDADSEGHEGKFYVWDREEVRAALTPAEYEAFAPRYGLDRDPNFEGRWHLHVFRPVEDIAAALGRARESIESDLSAARGKLLRLRERRVRPGRDDKMLASWNGLMIRGMAAAARALGRDDLAESAARALDFTRRALWRDGRLLATYNDGRAHLNAYLDDYAFLADAVLELQQVRFRADELQFARELLEVILRHHVDESAGGFFFTSDDHEELIHRPKSFGDDATPGGNGVAAFVLQRMGYLLGETRYLDAAERTVRAGWAVMEKYPQAHTSLLIALEELLSPPETVVLRGDAGIIDTWRRELARLYSPRRMVLAVPAGTPDLPPAIAEKAARGQALAYVCRGNVCGEPVDSFAELTEALRA
ncbi:MAG TPA: thioredoxin domain-containing protein [Steroidobacteraceae bacterium]|nr:thioredoxin domain-containing protein [Steroidobacteraceae bacterium]